MLWRKSKKTVMATGFAQAERMHQWRAGNRRDGIRPDRKRCCAAEKRNLRRRAAVGAVAKHGNDFTAAKRSDERNDIRRRTSQRLEAKFCFGGGIDECANFGGFIIKTGDIDWHVRARKQSAGGFPIADVRRKQ